MSAGKRQHRRVVPRRSAERQMADLHRPCHPGRLARWLRGLGRIAPLNSAVVASGTFVATGQNKLIQHLEGGILREMLVKEGDLVEPNQLLLRLDDTAANAKLRRLVLKNIVCSP